MKLMLYIDIPFKSNREKFTCFAILCLLEVFYNKILLKDPFCLTLNYIFSLVAISLHTPLLRYRTEKCRGIQTSQSHSPKL